MNYLSESRDLYLSLVDGVVRDAADDFELLPGELSRQQLLATTLYASIVEMTCDCIVLLEQPSSTSIGTIAKIVLEAYADLCSAMNDDQYADRMQVTYYKEKERLIKRILKRPEIPFNTNMSGKMDAVSERISVKNAVASHRARGHKPLKPLDRFAALPSGDETFGATYWQLCLQSHNNVAAIQQRHFLTTASGTTPDLFRPIDPTSALQYLDLLLSVVIHASKQVHEFMKTGAEAKYDDHMKDLRQLRESIAEAAFPAPTNG